MNRETMINKLSKILPGSAWVVVLVGLVTIMSGIFIWTSVP